MIHFKVIAKWKLLPGISWKWWLTTKINRTITILHVCIHAPLWSVFENQVGSPNIFAWYSLLKDFMKTIFQFNIFQFLSALGENMTLLWLSAISPKNVIPTDFNLVWNGKTPPLKEVESLGRMLSPIVPKYQPLMDQ